MTAKRGCTAASKSRLVGAGAAMVGYFQDVGFGIFCGNELLCRFFGVSFE